MACSETILVDDVDLSQWALITSAEGLLSTPPVGGDLIEMDWTPGAQWQQGVAQTYSFDVPMVINSRVQTTQLAYYEAVVAACKAGQQVVLKRKITVGGVPVVDSCQAVLSNAVRIQWDFRTRGLFGIVLVWQNLSGGWTRL